MTTDKDTTHTSTAMADLPDSILGLAMDETHDAFTSWVPGEREAYKIGFRGALQASAALARRSTQPVAPSPQVAEGAGWDYDLMGVPNEDVAALWRSCGHSGTPPYSFANRLQEKLRAAIAASRRASGGDAEKLASYPLEDFAEESAPDGKVLFGAADWKLTVGDVRAARASIATPAPASAGQATPALVEPTKICRAPDGCPDPWKCSSAKAGDCGALNIAAQPAEGSAPAWGKCQVLKPAEGAGQAGQVAMSELMEFAEKRLGLDLHGQTFADLVGLFDALTPTERAAAPAEHVLMPKNLTKEMRAVLKEAAPRWNAESIYANLIDATQQPSAQESSNG